MIRRILFCCLSVVICIVIYDKGLFDMAGLVFIFIMGIVFFFFGYYADDIFKRLDGD